MAHVCMQLIHVDHEFEKGDPWIPAVRNGLFEESSVNRHVIVAPKSIQPVFQTDYTKDIAR